VFEHVVQRVGGVQQRSRGQRVDAAASAFAAFEAAGLQRGAACSVMVRRCRRTSRMIAVAARVFRSCARLKTASVAALSTDSGSRPQQRDPTRPGRCNGRSGRAVRPIVRDARLPVATVVAGVSGCPAGRPELRLRGVRRRRKCDRVHTAVDRVRSGGCREAATAPRSVCFTSIVFA